MPTEVVEFLAENLSELKLEIRTMRMQMSKEHKELSERVSKISERVSKLEYHEKITRWIFGVVGGITALAAREIVPMLWKLLNVN